MKKILFLRPIWATGATFVIRDLEFLSDSFGLTELTYSLNDILFPLRLAKQLTKVELAYIWFSGTHAFWTVFLAKLMGKKTVIVVGGYDVAYLPEIGYGIRAEGGAWRRAYWAMNHADSVLAFSKSSAAEARKTAPRGRITVIPLGFQPTHYQIGLPKEPLVLTVCHLKKNNIKRKGLDVLITAAGKMPEQKFIIVGRDVDGTGKRLQQEAPSNVTITGYLDEANLLKLMGKSKVYAQLSAHEGFGCALAEAMLCGCVPVVTKRGALPEVAGPDAFYVNYGDPDSTADVLRLAREVQDGRCYRTHIENNYTLEKRRIAICSIINELIEKI